jgi:hypothetical protein
MVNKLRRYYYTVLIVNILIAIGLVGAGFSLYVFSDVISQPKIIDAPCVLPSGNK